MKKDSMFQSQVVQFPVETLLGPHSVMLLYATHRQLCTPESWGVSAIYHKTPSSVEGPPQADQTWACVA